MHTASRTRFLWLAAFLAFWALFGLIGRDAWTREEAIALGHVLDPDAVEVEVVAPFYILLARFTAWLTAAWLPVQDGARLASGGLTLAALLLTGLAAREFFGGGVATAAALALMGSFGLMLRAHALMPETALLMGYALLLYGIGLGRRYGSGGGMAIGVAASILTLTRGLPDLVAALVAATLPLLSADWRTPDYRRALAAAAVVVTALLGMWILWHVGLHGRDPMHWWQAATAAATPTRDPAFTLKLLTWFAWPVWPLAAWTLWHEHRRLRRESGLHPVLLATVVLFVLAHWPAYSRDGGALPLLIPLALLAAHASNTLKRGAGQAFYWFGVLCLLFFAIVFWTYFVAIEWGVPARLAARMLRLTPDFRPPPLDHAMLATAITATLLWLVAIPLFPHAKVRPILVWATGMALVWVLLIALFRPWAEANWGYRPVIQQLAAELPSQGCLRADTNEAMTVMLRLHLGARYRERGDCRYWLLEAGRSTQGRDDLPLRLLWRGYRPRAKDETYLLYERVDP